MSKDPNWDDIKRCSIWKVLGVTECNSCDGLVKCWGTSTQLPEPRTQEEQEKSKEFWTKFWADAVKGVNHER